MSMKKTVLLMAIILCLTGCGNKAAVSAESADTADTAPVQAETQSVMEDSSETDPADKGDVSMEIAEEPEPEEPAPESAIPEEWDEETTFTYTLCFSGDINLAEGQYTTAALDASGLNNCVSETLRGYMTDADLMCINHEFTYTTSSTPLADKQFTFRANPSRVEVMKQLGVDIAILANNHVFDYREEGLTDTMNTLDEAGIVRIGAGLNLDEASAIYYAELENCTVAYIAASRVEWSAQTQPASSQNMGVFYTAYDTDLLYQRVAEAKEKADFVVVCMHWGIEGTDQLEEYQTEVGQGLVEAGADVVVGDHPHQLQGVAFVDSTPVFYSLGNYWFSRKEAYTMLLNVIVSGDQYGVRDVTYQVVPAYQTAEAKVIWLESSEQQKAMFDYLTSMPGSNISIDSGGIMTKK